MILLQIVFDLFLEAVASHVIADVDGRREAFGVRAAMALDDDAVEAEEDAANTGKIYGMYFIIGLLWSGDMLILYTEIAKLVTVASNVNKLK